MTKSTNVRNKRYFVFAGEGYYAAGGWQDFVMATDDPEEATERAKKAMAAGMDWAEVIDLEVSLPVWRKGFSYGAKGYGDET